MIHYVLLFIGLIVIEEIIVLLKVSGWIPLALAITMFMYQTLDAIDGKQARRTGSSNALGELFDHGCDSLSNRKKINSWKNIKFIRNIHYLKICYENLLSELVWKE